MKVVMLIQEDPQAFADRSSPAAQAYWDSWMSYSGAVADKVVGGNVLEGGAGVPLLREQASRDAQDLCPAVLRGRHPPAAVTRGPDGQA
mgnify:CR=1 FL=1